MEKSAKNLRAAVSACMAALLGAAGGCYPLLGTLEKSGSAVAPAGGGQGGGSASTSLTQCPSFSAYQQQADPVVQNDCMACHTGGGEGVSNMLLVAGESVDTSVAVANFAVLRDQAVPTDGSATVDPSNPDGTSPLLERLNGTLPHDLILDLGGADYLAIRGWVTLEIAQTCVINPVTGVVTAPNPSPSASASP